MRGKRTAVKNFFLIGDFLNQFFRGVVQQVADDFIIAAGVNFFMVVSLG